MGLLKVALDQFWPMYVQWKTLQSTNGLTPEAIMHLRENDPVRAFVLAAQLNPTAGMTNEQALGFLMQGVKIGATAKVEAKSWTPGPSAAPAASSAGASVPASAAPPATAPPSAGVNMTQDSETRPEPRDSGQGNGQGALPLRTLRELLGK